MFRMIARGFLLSVMAANLAAGAAEPQQTGDASPAEDRAFLSQFQGLKAELQRYRTLAANGGWPQVPEGPTIRPGAPDPRLGVLARRLAVTADRRDSETAPLSLDETLEDGVRRFQRRHGLEVDGLVGRATLRALNTPVERRIEQIRLNLERLSTLLDVHDDEYVLVNIPAFKATVNHDGHSVWTTRVIVGEKKDQTPEFRSKLQNVVFNPSWSVPHSIASEELLPKMQQDRNFFANGGYQLYDDDGNDVDPADLDWSSLSTSHFPFRVIQRPGPQNQLGQIKFMLPNPYSVCMHDTPARYLFAATRRALSHGCIRVDDPLGFAEVILRSEGWTREQIDSQIESGATKNVVLSVPLPVYVVYWTASVDESGSVHFYDDIYDRDGSMAVNSDFASDVDLVNH